MKKFRLCLICVLEITLFGGENIGLQERVIHKEAYCNTRHEKFGAYKGGE